MKILVQICRLVVGVLFIISGFVKIIDPIGMGYKLEEYFSPSVLNFAGLMNFHLPLAVIITMLEIILGLFLLLGIAKKFTVWTLLAMISFFTFLTFYSAYFNKVTDCGCFGEALKLEPWTSFIKDAILLVFVVIILFEQRFIRPLFSQKTNAIIIAIACLVSLFAAYKGIYSSPLIDFRAYAVGKDLKKEMMTAEELGLKPSRYAVFYTLKNKETNETVTLNDAEYIADEKWYKADSPWEIIEDKTEKKRIYKGYEAPIKDFRIDCNGVDKTLDYLNVPKVVMVVVPFAEKLSTEKKLRIASFIQKLKDENIDTVILTNNPIEKLHEPVCLADQTVLKTITRSNPGIIVLENGVVKSKFHYNDWPTIEAF
ncbi:BT_3928 family protein [Vaginella massiliensis]|uniref:BT_3928 family protein n=1 Tax=Vaginella massiliensis TaxID=1816680 RepID=UPI00374FFDB8